MAFGESLVFVAFFLAASSTGPLASWRRVMAAVELPNSAMDEFPEDGDDSGIVVLPEDGYADGIVVLPEDGDAVGIVA